MKHIELKLPESLKGRVQEFLPEALAEMRKMCDALEIRPRTAELLQKDLKSFLCGCRCDDATMLENIAGILDDGKVTLYIQSISKFYITELFRHYCDVTMRWGVFGEMFADTSDGRTFFRDYCAIATLYLNATKAELMAIDTGEIQFEQEGRSFLSFKNGSDVPVLQGKFPPFSKEAYVRGALIKVKEWRKHIATGVPDMELSKAQDCSAIWRSFADTFAVTPLMKSDESQMEATLKKALRNYNEAQSVPVSESFAYRTIMGLLVNLSNMDLKPIRDNENFMFYSGTIGELYRILYSTEQSPDNKALNGFISSLRFWSQWRPVINGIGTLKSKGGKIRQIAMKKDIRVFDVPELPAQVDGKRTSASTAIYLNIHKAIIYGMSSQTQSYEVNGKTTQIPMKESLYVLPAGSFDSSHNTAEWDRFVLQMKRTSHKSEADLMDAVFDYSNRITLIRQDESLTEEAQQKAIRRMQKDKPRDKKTLTTFFDEAKQRGIITGFRQRAMKKNGKPEYVWRAVESVTE